MHYRLIAPQWLMDRKPGTRKVLEGQFSDKDIQKYNQEGYNVYYLPNPPSTPIEGPASGSDIDTFREVFVDYDIKSNLGRPSDDFLNALGNFELQPSRIVDSGNGTHAYWRVTGLDALSYLRLTRRLMRKFNTDPAVGTLVQLMRLPGTLNTKDPDNFKPCVELYTSDSVYTAEEFDRALPPITPEDEAHCVRHYETTKSSSQSISFSDTLPPKFGKLLQSNSEVRSLFADVSGDRSKADYRLGHLLFANEFTTAEAISVLVNSSKALDRAPTHRYNYAKNIVDKIWTYEMGTPEQKKSLAVSVKDILSKTGDNLKGTRFPCHPCIDNTKHGFRLGQVIGLVAGSGVGKTAFALNMFKWFAASNPEYHHFFIPLEQPANEIADRWQTLCGNDTALHDKVHILSNYDDEGNFRHLSFADIEQDILAFQKEHNVKIGCVVVDHIGALKKKGAEGESQGLMDICHAMKAFAVRTNTLLVMQSQTTREKAGIGDLELYKDAAYGTMYFESYCDYLITLWQPLKRCHHEDGCPTVTAFKFCKIRHKKPHADVIKEDVCYQLYFESDRELMRDMTQSELTSFGYFLPKATNLRKRDRKTDVGTYSVVQYDDKTKGVTNAAAGTNRNQDPRRH